MTSRPAHGRLSRRSLLRIAGASAAAAACGALAPAALAAPDAAPPAIAGSLAAGPLPLEVGVVVPSAGRSPGLGAGLLRGLAAAAAARQGAPLRLRAAWYDGGQAEALEQVAGLVEAGAGLVVAAMSRGEAARLGPLLAERRVPLLVADVGATMVRRGAEHPYIFRSSLGYWQSAWALGQWAAANIGRRALIATGFYDSGFDTVYALWSGLEQAGGERPAVVVTGAPGQASDLGAAARAAGADLVLGAYSGPGALAFVRGYGESGLGGLPLLGPGALAADDLLERQGASALGVRSAHSWVPQGAAARPGGLRDEFAALGYDAGLLAGAAADAAGGRQGDLRDALAAASVAGARGPLAFDQATLEAAPTVALREVRGASGGMYHATLEDLTGLARRPLAPPAGPRSGWRDAFLMV